MADDLALAQPAEADPPLDLPDRLPPQPAPLDLPDQAPRLPGVYDQVAAADPQRAADVVSLSRKLAEPEAFVDKHLDGLKLTLGAPAPQLFREIEMQRPVTSRFLQDPRNMAVAKDDLDNLTLHERLVSAYDRVSGQLSNDWRIGKLQAERAAVGFSMIPGISKLSGTYSRLGQDPEQRIREIDSELAGIQGYGDLGFGDAPKTPGFLRRSIDGAVQLAPMMLGGVKAGAVGAAGFAAAAGAGAGATAAGASLFVPPALAVAPAAAAVTAGVAAAPTGFEAGEAYYNFRYFAGQSYNDLRAITDKDGKPLDPQIAGPVAIAIGSLNAGLGLVQLGNVLNTFPAGRAFLSRFTAQAGEKALESATYRQALMNFARGELTSAGVMGTTLAAQTGVQAAGESFAKSRAGGEFPEIPDRPGLIPRLAESFAGGAGIGLVLGLPGLSYSLGRDSYRVRQLEHAQDFYRALGDTAEASKLRARLPEAHKKLVADLTKDGPVSTVYTPVGAVERYFQSQNIDAGQAMDQLGARASYEEAKATGGDVAIPLSNFVDRLVGTKHYAGLADDVKFDPEGLTANEVKERQAALSADLQRTQDQAAAAVKADAGTRAGYDAVLADVKGKLLAVKPAEVSDDQWAQRVDVQSKVVASLSVARAVKRGVSVEQAYDTIRHDVLGPADAGAAAAEPKVREEDLQALKRRRDLLGQGPAEDPLAGRSRPDAGTSQEAKGGEGRPPAAEGAGPGGTRRVPFDPSVTSDPVFVKAMETARPVLEAEAKARGGDPNNRGFIVDVYRDLTKQLHDERNSVFLKMAHDELTPEERAAASARFDELGRKVAAIGRVADIAWEPRKALDYYAKRDADQAAGFELTDVFRSPERFLQSGRQAPAFYSRLQSSIETRLPEKATAGQVEAVLRDANQEERKWSPVKVHSLDITPELRRAALEEGLPLFQAGDAGERAFYQNDGVRKVVGLMRSSDESSYLHEVAHIWLETEHDYVKGGKADEASVAQWKVLSDWLGVKDGQAKLTRDQQEQFARGFEAYLREGKAPSEDLRGAFGRLRAWLTRIYRTAKGLNVELSDPVRAVMDRMLASEDEISRASEETGYDASAIGDLADVPAEAKKRVRTLQERAHDLAVGELVKQQMEEIKGQNREFLEREKERLAARARKTVDELPVYRAQEELGGEGAKLRKEAQSFLDGKVAADRVTAWEVAAELHDFISGRDLAEKILAARSSAEEVAARVKAELSGYADLRNTSAIRERAMEAVHNEKQGEVLALERQILEDLQRKKEISAAVTARRRAEASAEYSAARERARELLQDKPIGEAQAFRPYVTQERAAAVRVARALAREDFAAAAAAKREQMLNHALYMEAFRNRVEIAKHQDYLAKFSGRGRDLLNMPYGFTAAIDGLLRRFGLPASPEGDAQTLAAIAQDMLRKGESEEDIANATGLKRDAAGKWTPETLLDLLRRINEDSYYAMSLPDEVLAGGRSDPKAMTLRELRLVRATVEAVASVGKGYTRFLSDSLKGEIRESAAKFRESVEALVGTPYEERLKIASAHASGLMEKISAIGSLPDAVAPELVNLLTICTYLDGGKEDGLAHQFIYWPLKRAGDLEIARQRKMFDELNGIFERHFQPKELANFKNERVPFDLLDGRRFFTKDEILSMALNWGNEGNRDRIRRGYNLDDAQVRTVLDTVSHEGWKFVQEVWDYLDSFWPEIAKLEMKVKGVEPRRVERSPMETRYGTFPGGYYPIAYDFERSAEAYKNSVQRNELYRWYSAAAAHTETGHAQARADRVNRPVRLSTDVLFGHLNNVVHDLEYRAAVIDVSRFLKQRDVSKALENAIGVRAAKGIGDALKDVASDQREHLGSFERRLRWFRYNATYSALSLRLFTLPMDLGGNSINAVAEIGPARLLRAMTDFALDPKGLKDFVDANSERMRHRGQLRDRDIMDLSKKWQGRDSVLKSYAFVLQSAADEALSYPLWAETYKRAVARHGPEKARDIADDVVTRTIGSGLRIDQVGAQKGSEFKKITSMFYSFNSVMLNRAWLDGKLAGLEYRAGNSGAAMLMVAKSMVFAWGLQSLNENFWREFFRNSQNSDDRERNRRMLARALAQPLGYVWLARDAANFLADQATGKRDSNFRLSPLVPAAETVMGPLGRGANIAFSDDKDFDQKYGEQFMRGVATLTGFPQQLNNLAFNLLDFIAGNGGELTWRDFVGRRTKR